MDKTPAYGAGDSGLESQYGLFTFGEERGQVVRLNIVTDIQLTRGKESQGGLEPQTPDPKSDTLSIASLGHADRNQKTSDFIQE